MNVKKGFARLLVTALALCVITACLPLTALAESGVTKWNGGRTISEHIYVKKPIEITGTGIIDVTGFYGIIRSGLYYQDNTPMITIKSGANIAFKNVYIGGVSWGYEAVENEDKESRSSLIYVEPGARLTLYNVDIFGNDNVASHTTQGGAILNEGILGLDDGCNIRHCSADVGGGIYNGENATLYMFGDSTVKKCQATLLGGGIANYGYAECNNSSIRECNVVTEEVVSTGGGGLYNEGSASLSAFTVESCTVVSDIATIMTGYGGGIYNENGGSLHLYDGCVVNECMALTGGGIASASNSRDNAPGTVTIEDTKITYNEAYDGGGIFFRNFFSTNENLPAVLTVGKAIKSSSDAYVYIENNEARCGAGISIHGNTEGSLLHKVYVNDNSGCQGAGVYMDTYLSGYDDDEATYVTNYPGATLTMTSYTHIEGNRDDGYWGREIYSSFGVFVGSRSTLKLKGLPVIKENNSRYMMNYALEDRYGSEAAIVVESPYCSALNVTDSNPSYRYSGMVELLDPEELPLTQEGYEPISLERWRHAYSGTEPYETNYFGTRLHGVVLTGYQNLGLESEELQTYFTGYCDSDTNPDGEYLMFTDRENNTVQTGHPASITVICGDQQYSAKVNPSGFYLESTVHIPGKVQTGWQIGDKIYGLNDAMTADISTVTEVIGIYEDKVYTITFHSNSYDSPNWTASIPIRYGETVTLNPNTSGLYYSNATLTGWSTDRHAYYVDYELGDAFTLTEEKNVDLYAHWEHTKVTYVFTGIDGCYELEDTNDGGILASSITNDYTHVFNYVDEAVWWSLPTPYKTGYEFLYWEYRGSHFESGDCLDEQAVGGNDTYFVFTAVFEPITTSVNYRQGNGVVLSKESQQVVFGEEYQFPSAEELIVSNPDPDYAYYFTYYYLVIDGEFQQFYPGDVVTVDWVEPAEVRPIFGQYSAYFQITVPLEAELDDKTLGFWVGTEAPQLSATATMEGYDQLGWRFTNVPGLESTIFPANYRFTTEEDAYQLICDYIISQDIRDRKGCPLSITAVMLAQDGIPFTAQAYVQNQSGEYEKVNGASLELFGITDRYTEGESYADDLLTLIPNGENYVFSHAEDVAVAYDGSSVCNVYFGFKRTYTVEHYKENSKDDGYTLVEEDTQTLYGSGTTNAQANLYDGFTPQPIEQLEIAQDGSTVVKVYYTRNVYTIQLDLDGGTLEGAEDIRVKYQGLFYLPQETPVKAGYTFGGWAMYLDGAYSATFKGEDLQYAFSLNQIPTQSVVAKAVWTARTVSDITLEVTHQAYQLGDEFVPFNATVTYDNGDTETAPVTLDLLSGFSTAELVENQTVTVTVGGKTAIFTITVTPVTYTLTYDVSGANGSAPSSLILEAGANFTPSSAEGLTKNGYTFAYWLDEENGVIYKVGNTYQMPQSNITLRAVWSLNKPVLSGTEGPVTFYYDGSARTAAVTGTHILNDAVITYRWYKLNPGESAIPSLGFSIDRYFESRCQLLEETTGTYDFVNIGDSGTYYCVVTATHGENVSQTAREFVVTVNKALPTKELTQTEFTYAPNTTFDLNDYVTGQGGIETFKILDKNGLAFDFGETTAILSNITKAGGTFTLQMTVHETETYAALTKTYTITLNKAKQSLYLSASPSTPTMQQTVTLNVSGNVGNLSYALVNGNATVQGNQIIPGGAGTVHYSVTAGATDLYEEATQTYSITFRKAEGNLAPDYQKPAEYTICVGHTSKDITLPQGWSWNGTHTFDQVINGVFSATFTPADSDNYNPYTTSISVKVINHQKGEAATCTTPCTCTLCGLELEPKWPHSYSVMSDTYLRTQGVNCKDYNTYWYSCANCGASAGDDPDATNNWYTGSTTGAHNMLADWFTQNGQHYHKCSVTGCPYKEDLAPCSGGTATCQTKAQCSTCGNAYGSLGDHQFDTSVYGHKDENGHAHKCFYCDAYDVVEAHIPNVDAPTQDLAKYCVVEGCGYVIAQKLNHTHTPADSWEYNTTYHWHDCVDNDNQEFGKAEHTFNSPCDTACADGCGYTRTVSHDYTQLMQDDKDHWYVCSVCGDEKPDSRVAHSGGTATCQTKAQCSTCGNDYGSLGNHQFDTSVYGHKDENGHAHKCFYCDAYDVVEAHIPNVDAPTQDLAKYCVVEGCGYVIAQKLNHTHTPADSWEYNTTYHWHDCVDNDNQEFGKAEHTFNSPCDTACADGCGYTRTVSHDYTQLMQDDKDHWYVCSVCGDEKPDSRVAHSGGTATCQTLAECGICHAPYGDLAPHTFSEDWAHRDEKHHAHTCTLCGEPDEMIPHTPNMEAPTSTQDQVCVDCGYVMAEKTGEPQEDPVVQQVIESIEGLPERVALEDAVAIQTARDAYDNLDETQKTKVTNYEKLVAAEKALADLSKPEEPHYGDVNGDGKVDAKDALMVLKFAVGKIELTPEQQLAAEVDGKEGIGAKDALEILKYAVKKIDLFPIEKQ